MVDYTNSELAFIIAGVGGIILAEPKPPLDDLAALALFMYAVLALYNHYK